MPPNSLSNTRWKRRFPPLFQMAIQSAEAQTSTLAQLAPPDTADRKLGQPIAELLHGYVAWVLTARFCGHPDTSTQTPSVEQVCWSGAYATTVDFRSTVHFSTLGFTTKILSRNMWFLLPCRLNHSRFCHFFDDFGKRDFRRSLFCYWFA